jgi:hypothetical protein
MLARGSVETLLLGLYCLREPKAVEQLHSANIKALADAFAYLEHAEIVPPTSSGSAPPGSASRIHRSRSGHHSGDHQPAPRPRVPLPGILIKVTM